MWTGQYEGSVKLDELMEAAEELAGASTHWRLKESSADRGFSDPTLTFVLDYTGPAKDAGDEDDESEESVVRVRDKEQIQDRLETMEAFDPGGDRAKQRAHEAAIEQLEWVLQQ